ncbi:WD40/YVTN/BNR-like repeat-containing protein [Piscinibacter sp.]|uniref:WD40/YVTN/BNR-like repeat-containing protein n=1 Tax=Piscinibacter sp. TaxID=1903157 RepID=UPI002C0F623D|nr:YCF48-related protein [Albitalea sp.]HUG20938.1 YCF48-related protein [Albitalea sp.]
MRASGVPSTLALSLFITFAPPTQAALDQLTLPALISPRAAQSMLLGVALAGERIVAVGERGIIVHSDDRGASWTQADVPLSATLTAVHFPTPEKGWAVGHDGVVLHTSDGGITWRKQLDGNRTNAMALEAATEKEQAVRAAGDPDALTRAELALDDARAASKFGPSRPLLSVWFKNETEGFAAGSYGLLLRTTNGGADWALWSDRIHNPDGFHFNAITATPAGTLLIAGEAGHVHRSLDGGITWQSLPTGYKGQLYGALGVRNASGGEDLLAFGFGGNLFRLPAGAKDWAPVPSGTAKNLTGGLLHHGEPVLIAQDGQLLLGSDHGRRFKPVAGVPLPAAAIAPAPGGSGVAVSGIGGVKLVGIVHRTQEAKP